VTEDRAPSTSSKTPDTPYRPTSEPTPQLVSKPKPPQITQEEYEAKLAARNVQSVIDKEQARLTPRARRAMLLALHKATGADLEAMRQSELEAGQIKAQATMRLAREMEKVFPKHPPAIPCADATVNAETPSE